MIGANATTVRRLLPALVVAAVLALSYMSEPPVLGATSDVGYGYGNNCGVKGSGFHDHGKACPNRPFPGKGKGLAIAIQAGNNGTPDSDVTAATTIATRTTLSTGSSTTDKSTRSSGKHHGRGLGLGRGNQPG